MSGDCEIGYVYIQITYEAVLVVDESIEKIHNIYQL